MVWDMKLRFSEELQSQRLYTVPRYTRYTREPEFVDTCLLEV